MKRVSAILFAAALCLTAALSQAEDADMAFIDAQISAHENQSGLYVLEKGEEALLARAWLADHAQDAITVQYFIWSTDNIGILASEALLRAAERGVRVRVLVDDLLIDAPDKTLLALALHPNIDIRIYNPKHSVGTRLHKRALNVVTNFRSVNQRMHDKTFVVDGRVAITGGRNMADEYFDYDHAYNFRDRDALVLGEVVKRMHESFERFWASELSVPVEQLYDGLGLMQKNVSVSSAEVQKIYEELHAYANSPENFTPAVHAAIEAMPTFFPALANEIAWGQVDFLSDTPGKNSNGRMSLSGGGLTSSALAKIAEDAREEIVIQSPYLVLSKEAIELFRKLIARGVKVRISTNSLASTDNLQAFSGYRNQRKQLLRMGLEIYEYKPAPEVQRQVMQRYAVLAEKAPVFAIHAKTTIVDSEVVYIGTYNLDPRSQNLNTEVGVVMRNAVVARAVRSAIETDIAPENSWNAATDAPDKYAPLHKRSKVRLWQMTPITPLL